MQSRPFPETPDARSPAGAEIRYLMEGETGNMIHSLVPPGQVNRATVHASVSEFWHILSGQGEIWRRDESGEEVTVLVAGVSIDIQLALPSSTDVLVRNHCSSCAFRCRLGQGTMRCLSSRDLGNRTRPPTRALAHSGTNSRGQ